MTKTVADITRVAELDAIPRVRPLPPPPPTLAQSLAQVAAIADRFALHAQPPSNVELLRATEISDDDIREQVAARARSLNTDELKVGATMFLQNYVYRIAAPALGTWVLHGRIPNLSASNVLLRFDADGRPADVSMISPVMFVRPGDHVSDAQCIVTEDLTATAMDTLLEQHVMAMHDRVKKMFGLGALLAKGQVSSQFGMAFTAIDTNTSLAWPHVVGPAMDFLQRSRDRIAGEGKAGDMIFKRLGDSEGVTFRRGTCCLVYKTPERGYCGGCPLREDDDRAQVYTDRLMNRAPECRCPPEQPTDGAE